MGHLILMRIHVAMPLLVKTPVVVQVAGMQTSVGARRDITPVALHLWGLDCLVLATHLEAEEDERCSNDYPKCHTDCDSNSGCLGKSPRGSRIGRGR